MVVFDVAAAVGSSDNWGHDRPRAMHSMIRRSSIVPFDHAVPLEETSEDLAWVRWLLQSVRARCERVVFEPAELKGPDVWSRWDKYGREWFAPVIGPRLVSAWHAAVARDPAALVALDAALDESLTGRAGEGSRAAGAVLLRTTRGARYQGALGHYRAAVADGVVPGHIAVVWAAVGNFFQLSLTNVLAEYLRLEWETGTRDLCVTTEPSGARSFSTLVSGVLGGVVPEPGLVRREG